MFERFMLLTTTLIALLLVVPGALAHETTDTEDGTYFITTGQQGEPVYTYQTTNLDLIVRENESGERGAAVPDVHETVNATLIGPGGEELTDVLTPQFGEEGRYEFENGYALTRPGVYQLRLEGTIGDTDVTGMYDMPGPIEEKSEVMFPDPGLPTLRDVADLQDRVDQLETELADSEKENTDAGGDGGSADAPGPGALVFVGLIAALVLAARRLRQ